jgi:2-polyprenyl-6-methoxyphenol hydroxylase-like FAD-dependent oxidoreductase
VKPDIGRKYLYLPVDRCEFRFLQQLHAHRRNMDTQSRQQHFLEGKTIIVAGAGIAGSAFVIALRKLWDPKLKEPTIILYDRDSPDLSAQREGYTVSLAGYDTSGGLVALNKLGLLDEILDNAVAGLNDDGAFKIWGPAWNEYASFRHKPIDGLPSASVRIARKDLRQVLHNNLGPSDSVQWNSRCLSARRLEDGRVCVQVAKGYNENEVVLEETCDVLIAADGANSNLRTSLRPEDGLEFAGAILRGGISRFDGSPPAPINKDWGFMLSGTGVSCFFSPVDKKSVVWGVGHLEADQVPKLDLNDEGVVQQVIETGLELGKELQEPFRTIVYHTDPKTVFEINAHDKKPFHHEEIDTIPVVFIGDSNHAVSPFAGFGANLALCDGWDLAQQLCNGRSLEDGITAYDDLAVSRALPILQRSRERLISGHKSNGMSARTRETQPRLA